MVSDAHRRLSGLLLQQSDRHPIRTLSGEDLSGYDAGVVRAFEQLRLIVRERDLRDADGVVFHRDGDASLATSFEDGDVGAASPLALATYRIEFPEIARLLRRRLGLGGSPVEALSHRIHALGARGGGRRRQQVYIVRDLRADRALEALSIVRAHADQVSSLVLTPTERELPKALLKQVENLQVLAISSLLGRKAEPFPIKAPTLQMTAGAPANRARLTVDSGGHVAQFDGDELGLQRRDFGVLVLLANEARNDGGFVSRDLIVEAIRQATGKDGNDEQIDKSMNRIRSALRRIEPEPLVETKRRVGYRLTLPPTDIDVS